MPKNITYYLGAGASAKALPTIQKTENTYSLADSFRVTAKLLKEDTAIKPEYSRKVEDLINNLGWLADNSEKYGTIDTFAKYLALKNDNKLEVLRDTLSKFFTILQFIYNRIDNRPLIFLTTVMQNGFTFPSNIKMISWNYDFQIQRAAEEFQKEEFTFGTGISHQTDPLIGYYPNLGDTSGENTSEVSLVHLNGIAGFYLYPDKGSTYSLNYFLYDGPKDINDFFKRIGEIKKSKNLLSFGWEKSVPDSFFGNRLEIAKSIIKDTDILVVIGYSFPFFNREIDNYIFSSIKESNRLEKIYFQDPFRTGEFLRNQFSLDSSIEIANISSGGNYHVPLEL